MRKQGFKHEITPVEFLIKIINNEIVMGIQLTKGGRFNLSKEAPNLKNVAQFEEGIACTRSCDANGSAR